jgi:Uri superfamily endonuclease
MLKAGDVLRHKNGHMVIVLRPAEEPDTRNFYWAYICSEWGSLKRIVKIHYNQPSDYRWTIIHQ